MALFIEKINEKLFVKECLFKKIYENDIWQIHSKKLK